MTTTSTITTTAVAGVILVAVFSFEFPSQSSFTDLSATVQWPQFGVPESVLQVFPNHFWTASAQTSQSVFRVFSSNRSSSPRVQKKLQLWTLWSLASAHDMLPAAPDTATGPPHRSSAVDKNNVRSSGRWYHPRAGARVMPH